MPRRDVRTIDWTTRLQASVANSPTRVVAVAAILGLLVFDLMGAVAVGLVLAALHFGILRTKADGNRLLFGLWLSGFVFRCFTAVIQSGYELVLPKPEDPLLYESAGRRLALIPATQWIEGLKGYSASTRGIIVLHALVARSSPFLRPGIYVAALSVACSMFSLLLIFECIGPHIRKRSFTCLALALALSPPFVFWTSQNTKEGFVILGVTLFGKGVIVRMDWRWILSGVVLCTIFRPYVGGLLCVTTLVGHGIHSVWKRLEFNKKTREFIWPPFFAAAFSALAALIVLKGGTATGREGYVGSAMQAGGGSLDQGIAGLGPSSILLSVLRSIFTPPPWFRPRSVFDVISIIEGTGMGFLLLLIVVLTLRPKFPVTTEISVLAFSLFSLCLIYGLGINIGTSLRIRTTIYPLVAILLSVLTTRQLDRAPSALPLFLQESETSKL